MCRGIDGRRRVRRREPRVRDEERVLHFIVGVGVDGRVCPRRNERAEWRVAGRRARDDVEVGERDEGDVAASLQDRVERGRLPVGDERREVDARVRRRGTTLRGEHLVEVEAVRDVHRRERIPPHVVGEVLPNGRPRLARVDAHLVDDGGRQIREGLQGERGDGLRGIDEAERREDALRPEVAIVGVRQTLDGHARIRVVVNALAADAAVGGRGRPVKPRHGVRERGPEQIARGGDAPQMARRQTALAHVDGEAHRRDDHEREHPEDDQECRAFSHRDALHRLRSSSERRQKLGKAAELVNETFPSPAFCPLETVEAFWMRNW